MGKILRRSDISVFRTLLKIEYIPFRLIFESRHYVLVQYRRQGIQPGSRAKTRIHYPDRLMLMLVQDHLQVQ